jgi:hypothetical protein
MTDDVLIKVNIRALLQNLECDESPDAGTYPGVSRYP